MSKRSRRKEAVEESFIDFFSDKALVVEEYKEKKTFGKSLKAVAGFLSLSVILGLIVTVYPVMGLSAAAKVAEPVAKYWKDLPSELGETSIAERNVLYDKNGDIFAEVWAEDRVQLDSLDKISDYAKNGLIATEDKRFYEHAGIDFIGTARSAVSGSGGGSGITQQLIKNLQFYDQAGKEKKDDAIERSLSRKLQELKYSMEYEKNHTKDEILLEYFNTVAFGGPNTYSIEAASQYFFGKSAKKLDLAEASALIGTANNPVLFNLKHTDDDAKWKGRQKAVLDRMVAEGHVTSEEAKKASNQKLKIVLKKSRGNCTSSEYPFYCEYVIDYLADSEKLGETAEERAAVIAKGGLHIKTHMDPAAMDQIDKKLEAEFGNNNRVVAPVALVEAGTGGVTAFGVNRDYGEGKGKTVINVADNPAATGSAYKVFTLAAALNSGRTESSLTFDAPCVFAPQGYDYPNSGFKNSQGCGKQAGVLDYLQGTAYSSNTWYTKLATQIGLDKVYDISRQLNLNVPENLTNRSLSFVLGPVENSPIDMAAAYATFTNKGVFCPATPIEDYHYSDGSVPAVPDTYRPEDDSCKRVTSPATASTVLKAMRANTYGDGIPGAFGTQGRISGYDSVGKSGTNQRYNYTQGQVSADYGFFIDIYDMDRVTRGVYQNSYYRGQLWPYNYSAKATSSIFGSVLKMGKNKSLDFNNRDTSFTPVAIEKRDYFTIPSVLGMTAEQAVDAMSSIGIPVYVSKETVKADGQFPVGVIGEQSISPGEELPVGTKKEIVLYITE